MKNVRRLTEGAVLLAIFAVLLLITLYVPFLGLASNFFLAVPFIYFAWKNDWKGIIVFLIASIVISFIVGTIFAIPIALLFGTTGVTLGYLVQKNKSRTMILMVASLVFLINMLIQYATAVAFFQFNFISQATTILNKSFDTYFEILNSMGKSKEAKQFQERFESMLQMIETIMPSLFVMSSFLIVFLLQLVNFPLLKKFGLKVNHWKSFRDLSLPKSILWYYLISVILLLLLKLEEGSYFYIALVNLSFMLQILLVIHGLALVYYFSHIKGWPRGVPIAITFLLFFMPILLYIIRILGIIDLGFELRKKLDKQ